MNKNECLERSQRLVGEQLDSLEEDAGLLRAGGHTKHAERLGRDIARLRRRAERKMVKTAASDARTGAELNDLITKLEYNLDGVDGGE